MEEVESSQQVLNLLENTAFVKQQIFKTTSSVFNQFKVELREIWLDMQNDFSKIDQNVGISFSDRPTGKRLGYTLKQELKPSLVPVNESK